ncbi:MAG TPA: Gfo/Idh/MocA family oxidoreductase [Opitutus sp.]|nr:Gfo/Idh/MocA family oxidoreductase [Opitutus sp.]
MNSLDSSRREFLKRAALAGAGLTLPAWGAASAPAAAPNPLLSASPDVSATRPRPAGQKPVHDLTTAPRDRVRVGVIGLHRGMTHVDTCLGIDFAEVVAVCDVRADRAGEAAAHCAQRRGRPPAVYQGTEHVWEQLVDRDDIDVVYIATPWAWHVPMALRTLERGKHAFVEVAAALSIDDCWRLVDASERAQRHLVMLENCCYGENELFVLNLARAGVFGELAHAECGYLHDLREVLFELGSEGDWRRDYHCQLNGNLYPTHGLGPVAQYLGVGRGDRFKSLVSMSSPESSLTKYRDGRQPNGGRHAHEKYVCGDMNTSIVQTERGRTIVIQHDVVSPRPYSRINALLGTGATFFDYPVRLAINEPKTYALESSGPHEWLGEKDLAAMRAKFSHPLWAGLAEAAKGGGHGGMDYVMNWRHLDCLRRGATPDSVVYDAAAWSSIIELSVRSVAAGSAPVGVPDFTRGLWQALPPLGIASV